MGIFELWQKARKSPKSGDLAIALGIAFLARSVPAWVGVYQPSTIEAAAFGVAVGLLSMSFDLIPNEDDA